MRYENKKIRNKIIIPFKNHLLKRKIIMKVKFLLIAFLLIPMISYSQVIVEKIFETSSLADYNKWVQENKEKYPELQPIYFQIKKVKDGKYVQNAPRTFTPPPDHPAVDKYEIYYYTEGKKNKESISGYLSFFIYDESEYIGIRRLDHPSEFGKSIFIIKNKERNELFQLNDIHLLRYLTGNLFIAEPPEFGEEVYDSLMIFDEKGRIAGYIYSINPDHIEISPNQRYISIIQGPIGGWAQIVIFSKDLSELWRKKFKTAVKVNLGNEYVAIGDSGKIYIYNIKGELLHTYKIAPGSMTNPYSIFIDNERFLAALPGSNKEVRLFDMEKKKEVWRLELQSPAVVTAMLKRVFPLFNKFILIVCWNDDVMILDKNGKIVKKWNLSLLREEIWRIKKTKELKSIKVKDVKRDWRIKIAGHFLIATKGRIVCNFQPYIENVIVYKIEVE